MKSKLLILSSVLSAALFSAGSQAQIVGDTVADGSCQTGYTLIVDVCLAQSALGTHSTSELIQLIEEHKGIKAPKLGAIASRSSSKLCQSKISEHEGDFFELRDGSFLKKTGYGYMGYIGYAKDTLLILKFGSTGTLVIEGKSPFKVDVIRAPTRCSSPSSYPIEMAHNDEKFVINGELFEAKTYCLGWDVGESVIFLDGSEYGVCVSAELYNIDRSEECSVWCE